MPAPAASPRTVARQRDRAETKQHGRTLTDQERAHMTRAQKTQFEAMAHQKAIEFKDIIAAILDEMVYLLSDLPTDRAHKGERVLLEKKINQFKIRVRGARAFVIHTGLKLVASIPNNPAESPLIDTSQIDEKTIIVPS